MPLTVSDILHNADLFRRAYPNWPHAEPEEAPVSKWISKREARNRFLVARMNERQMFPAAEQYQLKHGTWPGDFLQAQHVTARAFEVYLDAGYSSGITVEG